jgi:hypothetical protein
MSWPLTRLTVVTVVAALASAAGLAQPTPKASTAADGRAESLTSAQDAEKRKLRGVWEQRSGKTPARWTFDAEFVHIEPGTGGGRRPTGISCTPFGIRPN